MSSASEESGTRRRMKLLSRERSSATISEIRRSCSVIDRPDSSFIHSCRRTAPANIVGNLAGRDIGEQLRRGRDVGIAWSGRLRRLTTFNLVVTTKTPAFG